MFSSIAFGSQDQYLSSVTWFDMENINVCDLDVWPIEQRLLRDKIDTPSRLPIVLIDIIISYSGSTHRDALCIIGRLIERSLERSLLVKISNQEYKHARKTTYQMMDSITKLIGYPRLGNSIKELTAIIRRARKVVDYDDWPDESAGPNIANIFYAILLLGWSNLPVDDVKKIDNAAR